MSDEFDVAVQDADALAEIEMLANLIVATSEHPGRLPERRIDEILGVTPAADDHTPDGRAGAPAGHDGDSACARPHRRP